VCFDVTVRLQECNPPSPASIYAYPHTIVGHVSTPIGLTHDLPGSTRVKSSGSIQPRPSSAAPIPCAKRRARKLCDNLLSGLIQRVDVKIEYPDDADGDALRNVAESGADMSRPMVIDFSVEVPDERSARRVAEVAAPAGFDPSLFHDDESDSWSVYCAKEMLATYETVVGAQADLNRLVQPHGGHCDGWGTFGNTQDARSGG
jgi:hypothetical protein